MNNNDYKVGYGKPPENARFKKGQSGNLKGRPLKRNKLEIDVDAILNEKVQVKTGAGERKIGSRELWLRDQLGKALNGNLKAALYVIGVFEMYGVLTAPSQQCCAIKLVSRRSAFLMIIF
ncbi:MAG: DUF5681 domain-containing protein [Rhizobiaceae bacterium]